MNVSALKQHLERDEGNVSHVYQDSEGYWTIGVGHLVDKRLGGELDRDVIEHQLSNDIERVEKDLQTFPWWNELDEIRQLAVANMRFNLGPKRFRGFKKMIKALESKDYIQAGLEAEDSKWFKQTGNRAKRIVQILMTGLL